MDCYEGSENRNANVSFENYEFPQIAPGENEVSFTSGISSVSIRPRWWTV
jgi:phage-related protein